MGCCNSKDAVDASYSAASSSGRPGTQDVNRNTATREAAWKNTGIVGLRDANLRELPGKIFADPVAGAARNVDASNNRIVALPPSVSQLVNLQRLTLSSNLITSLPAELCECVALRVLVLDRNQIASFPSNFQLAKLTRLQTLSLAHNKLTAIPPDVGSLVSLTKLGVAGNQLAALPVELGSCSKLELDASNNPELSAIPQTLGQLSRVATINLDNTKADPGRGALVTLSLHGCPIRSEALEATPGYAGFAARVRGKHSKKIHGGAMVGSKGLDDGVDRDTARDLVVPHT